jgi:hypothetical protein
VKLVDDETTHTLKMILGLDAKENQNETITFEIDKDYENSQFLKVWVIRTEEGKETRRNPVFISKIALQLSKQSPSDFEMPAPW